MRPPAATITQNSRGFNKEFVYGYHAAAAVAASSAPRATAKAGG
jgi:hypothetical protein